MFSKFSVLPKFYNHLRFPDNGLLRMFSYITPSPQCTAKIVQRECGSNIVLMRRDPMNCISVPNVMLNKNGRFVEWTRKMSSDDYKGNGENLIKTLSGKKDTAQVKKSKTKWLKRRYKGKISKKSESNRKRRKYLTQRNLIFEEIKKEVPTHPILEKSVKKEIFSLKPETFNVNKRKNISQSQLPPKKVHIEFMESHNLKDFKLSKIPPSQQIFPTNIIPSTVGNKSTLNVNETSQDKDIKLILFVSETQQLTKSGQDPKKQIIKSFKTKNFKNKNVRKKKVLESQNKKVKSQMLFNLQNKKEDLNIIKFPTKPNVDKNETMSDTLSSYSEPLKRTAKSAIFKNVSQKKTEAMKEGKGWEQNNNDMPIKVSSKKFQPRLSKFNRSKMLKEATKKILGTIETLKNPPLRHEMPLPKLVENTQAPNSNSITEPKNRITMLLSTPNNFSKTKAGSNIDAATKTHDIRSDSEIIQSTKNAPKMSPNERNNGGLKPTHIPKNMFGENIPPEKLKNIETMIMSGNAVPKTGRPTPKKRGSTIKRTSKSNKFKRFGLSKRSGGGGAAGGGGDQGSGRGGDKSSVHNIPITPPEETPSGFWRSVSISMVPVILGFTAYMFHHMGAFEMFKDFVFSIPDKGQTTLKAIPAFYRKDSENFNMDNRMQREPRDNDIELNSNDYDEEQDNSNSNGNKPSEETYVEDSRLV